MLIFHITELVIWKLSQMLVFHITNFVIWKTSYMLLFYITKLVKIRHWLCKGFDSLTIM